MLVHGKGIPTLDLPAAFLPHRHAKRHPIARAAKPLLLPLRDVQAQRWQQMSRPRACWQTVRCQADGSRREENSSATTKESDRQIIDPAMVSDLDAVAKNTDPLAFLGGSCGIYGILIAVAVAFTGKTGGLSRSPCRPDGRTPGKTSRPEMQVPHHISMHHSRDGWGPQRWGRQR